MSRTVDWMKLVIEYVSKTKNFERHVKNIKMLSINDGECKAELVVSKCELNTEGHLDRGLTTTLVDILSSWALFSHENKLVAAVSTNIHVTFFKQALLGDVLSINAKVSRVELPLAFVEVELAKQNNSEIVARGQHTLFLKPS